MIRWYILYSQHERDGQAMSNCMNHIKVSDTKCKDMND